MITRVARSLSLALLTAPALAGAVHAAVTPTPYAVFDRLRWAPDGHALAVQAMLYSDEFSRRDPLRVDTLVIDPVRGLASTGSPRVEGFALNAARDSILFADAYGLYIMPVAGGHVRPIVWRRPASPVFIRRLGFAAGGGYIVNTACFNELSIGCNQQWFVPGSSDRVALTDLRTLQGEGVLLRRAGEEAQYVQWQPLQQTTPFSDGTHRAALLRGVLRAERIAGATPPEMDVRLARPLGDGRSWVVSVGLHKKRPWLSRTFTVLYVPQLKDVRPVAEDALSAFLADGRSAFYYNTVDGRFWHVDVASGTPTRSRISTSDVPEWARTLGPATTIYQARAVGIDTPTKADELASSLTMAGYHAWSVPDAHGHWGVAVGWYGTRAEAESLTATLSQQGYATDVRDGRFLDVRGTIGSRSVRPVRAAAPAGALAGTEAILDVAPDENWAACAILLRARGEEPRVLLTGFTDEAPVPPAAARSEAGASAPPH